MAVQKKPTAIKHAAKASTSKAQISKPVKNKEVGKKTSSKSSQGGKKGSRKQQDIRIVTNLVDIINQYFKVNELQSNELPEKDLERIKLNFELIITTITPTGRRTSFTLTEEASADEKREFINRIISKIHSKNEEETNLDIQPTAESDPPPW